MKFSKSMILTLSASGLIATSCIVSDSYSLDDIDLGMTLFEDQLELPIGSTGKLTLGDFLDEESSNFLKTAADGSYAITLGGDFDLGDKLPDLTEKLTIKGVDFSETFKYDLGEFADGNVSIPGKEFNNFIDLGGFSGMKDFDIAPIDFKTSLASEISDMMPDASAFKFGVDPVNYKLPELFDLSSLDPSSLGSGEVEIPSDKIPAASVSESVKLSYSNTLPSGESIKSVKLSSDSEIVISVKTGASFLSSGSVVADLDVDFSGLFVFMDGTSKINLKTLALNAANGFSNTKAYKVKSISQSCFNGNSISVDSDVKVDGQVSISGGKTSSTLLAASRKLGVEITVSCDNITFEDIALSVKDYTLEEISSVDVKFNDITLPEQVQDVESISFTDNSAFTIAITPKNIPSTLSARLSKLELAFPSEIVVDGAVGGKVSYENIDLSKPFTKVIKVNSINIPDAVDGKISFDRKVDVKAYALLSGEVNTSALSSGSANQMNMEIAVTSDLAVADYSAKIKEMSVSLDQDEQSYEIELPSGLENFGTFVVTPEGKPEVKINLAFPQTSLKYSASSEGIVITVPQMMELGDVKSPLVYDRKNNTVTIKGELPSEIVLPVSKLIVTPAKNADGKSVVSGSFLVSGGIFVPSATISKKDIDEIAKSGIRMDVVIPELKSSSVSIDRFEINVDAVQEITILKAGSLPSEIKSITSAEMSETYLNLDVDFKNLPSLGAGRTFNADIEVVLPEFMKPSKMNVKGSIKDGKFTASPVRLESIDFSSFDLSKDIKGEFKFNGGVSVDNPTVNLSELKGEVSATVKGSLSDIRIKKVTGKVDIKIDNITESVKIEGLPEFLTGGDAVLDLYNPALNITMTTNIGIPVTGKLSIRSMKDGREISSQTVDIDLPYSQDGSTKTRTFHLSSSSENCPSDFEFKQVDFASLIKTFPDELLVSIDAGTDPEKESTISSDSKYDLDCSYEFNMPLALGKDFRIEMKDTLDLAEDIAKYLDMAETVLLYGSVENALPVEISLNLSLLDADGNMMPLSAPASQTIKACSSDGHATVSPLEIAISHKSSIAAARSMLLTFSVTSGGAAGNSIRESDYVQATLGAAVKGGITLDPKNID